MDYEYVGFMTLSNCGQPDRAPTSFTTIFPSALQEPDRQYLSSVRSVHSRSHGETIGPCEDFSRDVG